MERKPIRDIDLFFFSYRSYYNKNDEYVVSWEINWLWVVIAIAMLGSALGLR